MPRFVIGALLSLLLLSACDSQQEQDEFADQASRPASGYTITTEDGEVVEEDPDDWRMAPYFESRAVRVDPAYPNPVQGQIVSLEITIPFSIDVQELTLSRRVPGTIQLRHVQTQDIIGGSGLVIFTFSAATFATTGIHRVFVFDERAEILTYGDILVE